MYKRLYMYPPTPVLAKAGAAPGTTAGVELVFPCFANAMRATAFWSKDIQACRCQLSELLRGSSHQVLGHAFAKPRGSSHKPQPRASQATAIDVFTIYSNMVTYIYIYIYNIHVHVYYTCVFICISEKWWQSGSTESNPLCLVITIPCISCLVPGGRGTLSKQ